MSGLPRGIFALLLAITAAAPARAAGETPVEFAFPLNCAFGTECFIQHYPDLDPTEGAADYRCGQLSYDGHSGTDFRLHSVAQMNDGVEVLAAAPGTVIKVHDGEEDRFTNATDLASTPDAINGNGLVIDHGGSWQSVYGHLRQGSLRVAAGDRVEAGQPLGLVGVSGNSNFPHLHFTVVKDYREIDPFSGKNLDGGCENAGAGLWQPALAERFSYVASGLLDAGFATERPKADKIRADSYDQTALPRDARNISFWGTAYGLQTGDRVIVELFSPKNVSLARKEKDLTRNRLTRAYFVGLRRSGEAWPAGTYRGVFTLERPVDGVLQRLFEMSRDISVGE